MGRHVGIFPHSHSVSHTDLRCRLYEVLEILLLVFCYKGVTSTRLWKLLCVSYFYKGVASDEALK